MAYGIEGLAFGEMKVCAVCGEIYGEFSEAESPELYYQECDCRRGAGGASSHYGNKMKVRLNLDFAEKATLCYCCGRELIPSGSRYSSFFCDYCGGLIRRCAEVDRHLLWIPLGRHTLMNRISLRWPDVQDENKVNEFAAAANGLFARVDELCRWKKLVVSRNLDEAGFLKGTDIALPAYLTAVSRDSFSKHRAFLALGDFVHEKYGDAPPPPDTSQQESLPFWDWDEFGETNEAEDKQAHDEPSERGRMVYTPKKELDCVFETLAIRNQALEQKYPDGLMGYLRKNGGYYNDEITTQCYMGPEYYDDVADLIKNGLVEEKDFIVFSDDGVGKDSMPFPLGVDWLRGYCLERHIMIFMVS